MKTTIKDVARESGFSTATVSLALSDKPSRIAPETKARIKEVAKRLSYTPNRMAVSLATSRSKMVGIVLNDLRNTHISTEFMAISSTLQKHGYFLVNHSIMEGKRCTLKNILDLISCGVEGIIFSEPDTVERSDEDNKIIDYLRETKLPIVSRDNLNFQNNRLNICVDYYEGGYIATKHLIENGHRKVGCITGVDSFRVTRDRLLGYKRALAEFNIPFDPKLVYRGDYTLDSGSLALSHLLGQKCTGIFAFNDEMAFGIYRSARQYGIKIPKDISIVGFDNVPFGNVLEIPLDTMHVPTEIIGETAAKEMVSILEGNFKSKKDIISFTPELRVRGSVSDISI